MPPDPLDLERAALTTDTGRALLAAMSLVAAPTPADIARWRSQADEPLVTAALRLATARRRAVGKFRDADRMWLDAIGLEQATSDDVAAHKARRFATHPTVDLCSGIGGDAIAMARAGTRVISVDRSHAACRRSRWNAEVAGVSLLSVRGDAERFPIPPGFHVHIDPDRRPDGGRRALRVENYAPSLPFLRGLMATVPGGAIKLGPADDFNAAFPGDRVEIELISLRGECKEATVWFGDLATARRRATCLPAGASWSDRDGDPHASPPIAPASPFVATPDPALSRAGLVDSLGAYLGLRRYSTGCHLLSAERAIESPFLRWFAVREDRPFDRRSLARLVKSDRLGPLEIKVMGVDVLPETLRRELGPEGPNPATLLVVPGADGVRVLVATRLPVTPGRAS